jgi:ribosomal protein S6
MSEHNETVATRLYELGFILVPTTPEFEVPAAVDALKAVITGVNGTISSEGTPEYIDLAYTMEKTVGSKRSKYSQGYFGWIKFETTPDTLEVLKKAFDASEALVRYMMIKTDATNTIVFKKPKVEAKRGGEIMDEDLTADEDMVDEVAAHEALPDLAAEVTDAPVEAVTEEVVEVKETEDIA